MSLFVEVYVGNRDNRILVADAVAHNVSNLAETSNYTFRSFEKGHEGLGIPRTIVEDTIKDHYRNQTVWALVEKIAKSIQED